MNFIDKSLLQISQFSLNSHYNLTHTTLFNAAFSSLWCTFYIWNASIYRKKDEGESVRR